METYRHATYRYSTGQGFNVNVNVPEETTEVASYKMYPLEANLIRPEFNVDLKREADRVSMQVEAAQQEIKVLGYDPVAGKRYRQLKQRLEVIKHLVANYPIEYIKKEDLENIYKLYEKNAPGLDKVIKKVVKDNKNATGVKTYIDTAKRVRKGYPLFDQYGRKLSEPDVIKYEQDLKKADLSGFGDSSSSKLPKLIGSLIIIAAIIKLLGK